MLIQETEKTNINELGASALVIPADVMHGILQKRDAIRRAADILDGNKNSPRKAIDGAAAALAEGKIHFFLQSDEGIEEVPNDMWAFGIPIEGLTEAEIYARMYCSLFSMHFAISVALFSLGIKDLEEAYTGAYIAEEQS